MNVLVVYASRHGATQGIAERIAAVLNLGGVQATVQPAERAGDLTDYEAFVIGSAVYATHWRKEATEFVRRNRSVLASRPVWLFSSGPLGTETTDSQGRDLTVAAEPKEIDEFKNSIEPRSHRVFFGVLDPRKLGFAERLIRKMPAGRELLPEGDFRDWVEIESWAGGIVHELAELPAGRR